MRSASGRTASVVVCLAALLIIVYGFSLEQRRMIGDEEGHDPGSRALPLAAGAVMLAAGLYEVFRPSAGSAERSGGEKGGPVLFLVTLGCAGAYVLLLEPVGFILLTTLFMYVLFVVYGRAVLADADLRLRAALLGSGAAALFAAVLYTAGRLVSRELFYLGRSAGIEFLASRTGSVMIFVLLAGLIFFPAWRIVFRRGKKRTAEKNVILHAIFLSAAATLFLYVVFRMMFRVNFPAGLLFW